MRSYRGTRSLDLTGQPRELSVSVWENQLAVGPLEHLCRHSPDGFECGYGGSGPADLARSMLFDHYRGLGREGREQIVEKRYKGFKDDVIAKLPRDLPWVVTEDQIDEWASAREE